MDFTARGGVKATNLTKREIRSWPGNDVSVMETLLSYKCISGLMNIGITFLVN